MTQHPPEITSPSIYYTAEDLRTVNYAGETLLEQAIGKGEKEKFYILLQAYEDQNIPIFAKGLNAKALIFSINRGYTDIFKTLLGKGADIKQGSLSSTATPLEASLVFWEKEISDILLKEYEDRKIPIFTEGQNIAALNRSIERGYIDIVRRLLGHQGVNVRVPGISNTALKIALYYDKKEIADLLATFHAISDVELNEE